MVYSNRGLKALFWHKHRFVNYDVCQLMVMWDVRLTYVPYYLIDLWKIYGRFRQVLLNLNLVIEGWGIPCGIALRWISLNPEPCKWKFPNKSYTLTLLLIKTKTSQRAELQYDAGTETLRNRMSWYFSPRPWVRVFTLQWRNNERDGFSNHQRLYCLFNRLFRHWSKKASKLRVTEPVLTLGCG